MNQRGFAHALLLIILLVGLAFGVYLVQQKTNLFSRASSNPISGPVTGNNINWTTDEVSLEADNFFIEINAPVQGQLYGGDPDSLEIVSNPISTLDNGDLYTTLEATWQENGREMRMFMYFSQTDQDPWKLFELRTYNGAIQGDWIYYTPIDGNGNDIGNYLGQTYINNAGPIEFHNTSQSPTARIVLDNVRLKAF